MKNTSSPSLRPADSSSLPRFATLSLRARVSCAGALLIALACTTTQAQGTSRSVTVDGVSMPAEDYAKQLLDEGNTAWANHDDKGAIAAFRRVTTELADTNAYPQAAVSLARLLLESDAKDAPGAQRALEDLLLKDPTCGGSQARADDARYLLAMAQLAQGDARAAAPTLKSLVDKLPEDERGAAMIKLGDKMLDEGQATEGVRYLARAAASTSGEEKARIEERIVRAVDTAVPFTDIRMLQETEAKPGTVLDEVTTMKLARVHLHLNNLADAQQMADRYQKRYPQGRFAQAAAELSTTLVQRTATDSRAIGVLLPLTGSYAAYGKRALTAIKLGFGIAVKGEAPPPPPAEPVLDPKTGMPVDPPPDEAPRKEEKARPVDETISAPGGLKIIVRDTAGDPQKTQALVRDLVEKEHVIALLGDILLDTSLPAALAAEESAVPILSLSRRDGVPEAGPWSFRLALTAKKQARALVEMAVDGRGMKRFAIIYPKHAFGVELMNELWDQLDKRQCEVTAVEAYAHDQTTFTAEAKSLVGRGMAASTEVAKCREEARAIDNEYRKKKAIEGCADLAKPVVDFEALFIPDSYRAVSYVIPALIAEDVLVTKDRRTVENYQKTTGNKAVRPVQLLGVSMWNDPELGKRLGRSIDGAIFVDGFDATDQTPPIAKFVQGFAAVHNSRPAVVEAQARDGAALLAALLSSGANASGVKTREGLRAALEATKDFPGVTGLISFDEQGDSTTQPRFFQVDGDRIEARDAAALAKGESG